MVLHRLAARDGDCDLFENDEGFDPCEWSPDGLCHESKKSAKEQCTCSGILYLVWASCDACSPNPKNTTWDNYSNQFDCTGFPQQFPSPLPTGEKAFPAWASLMAFATPTPTVFDLAAASAFVLGPSATGTPPILDQPPKTSGVSTPVQTTTGTTVSQLSPPSTTAQQAPISTHRNSFPAGAIAGIVVGLCLVVSVGAFIYLRFRRRRREPVAAGDIPPFSPYTAATSTPGAWDAEAKFVATRRTAPPEPRFIITNFPDAPSVPSNASPASEAPLFPIGQRNTHHESRIVQQKAELVEQWLSTSSTHPARALSTVSVSNAGTAAAPAGPNPDVVLQLRAMTARVRELEAQVEPLPQVYSWPGTPPPGYSGAGRSSTRASRQS